MIESQQIYGYKGSFCVIHRNLESEDSSPGKLLVHLQHVECFCEYEHI